MDGEKIISLLEDGASVAIGKSNNIIYSLGDAIFDADTMTESLVTSAVFMGLASQKKINLNAVACKYWPDFSEEGKEDVTIRHLLKHTSGLPSDRPYYKELAGRNPKFTGTPQGREFILACVANEALECPPTYTLIQSKIGYMALGHIAEIVGGMPLDKLFEIFVGGPLKLENSSFSKARPLDENAAAMGGVAGHSGFFATAKDAVLIGLGIVQSFKTNSGIFPQAVVDEFIGPKTRYKLGWEGFGHISHNSIGCTNSKGATIFIDLDNELVIAIFGLSEKTKPGLISQIYSAVASS